MLYNLFGSLSTFAPGPIPPPPYLVAGGNRSEVPYTYNTISNGNYVRQCSIHVQSPASAKIKNPRCWFSFWNAFANGGEGYSSLRQFYLKAALEYPLGNRYAYYFNGSDTQLMSGGIDALCQLDNAVNIIVPANTSYWIRIYQEFTNSDGSPYTGGSFNAPMNQLLNVSRNECSMGGTDPSDNRTVTGSMTAVAAATQVYGPTLIYGEPLTP